MGNINDIMALVEQYKQNGGDMAALSNAYQATTAVTKTPLGLNQWVPSDKPAMSEFNEDNRIIDEKIRGIDSALGNKVNLWDAWGPNILHNWDFRNPVNQRGKMVWTAEDNYLIDRWQRHSTSLTAALMNGVMRLGPDSAGGFGIRQNIEFPELYAGKTLTLSAKMRVSAAGSSISVFTNLGQIVGSSINASSTPNEWATPSVTFTIPTGITSLFVLMFTAANVTLDVESVKLELGTVSTLANDPPMDFGKELAVCQRYQFVTSVATYYRPGALTPDILFFDIPVPVSMRIVPTVIGGLVVRSFTSAAIAQTGFTFTFNSSGSSIRIGASRSAHGLTDARLDVPNNTIFDANI